MSEEGKDTDATAYGDPMVGVWRCLPCKHEVFPRRLREDDCAPPFRCPKCTSELIYDEEA